MSDDGGGDGIVDLPGGGDGTPFGADGPDDWNRFLDHVWAQHAPGGKNRHETEFPEDFTRDDVDALVRDIGSRRRVSPPGPDETAELHRQALDDGTAVLVEVRPNWINLFGAKDGVRYEIRVHGNRSTVHPVDGAGIVRINRRTGHPEQVEWGKREIAGWPTNQP